MEVVEDVKIYSIGQLGTAGWHTGEILLNFNTHQKFHDVKKVCIHNELLHGCADCFILIFRDNLEVSEELSSVELMLQQELMEK